MILGGIDLGLVEYEGFEKLSEVHIWVILNHE